MANPVIKVRRSYAANTPPTAGQLAEGQLAVNIADKRIYVGDNVGGVVELTSVAPYDIAGFIPGKPSASAVALRFVAVRSFTIAAALVGSVARSGVAATASTVLTLAKNGAQFGTLTFAPGSAGATGAAATSTVFAAGDILTVTAPAVADATFADCGFTLVAVLA